MSSYEEISKNAEADLNTYQAKTGAARPQADDNAGINSMAEKKFESAHVEAGDELSTNSGFNKRIPPSEGGITDDKGRQARGDQYEGHGGPLDKLQDANEKHGGVNDNDVVPANVPKVDGRGGVNDITTQGQAAMQSNVGRNPAGPGGNPYPGADYAKPDSVPDPLSAQGNIAPSSVVEGSAETKQ